MLDLLLVRGDQRIELALPILIAAAHPHDDAISHGRPALLLGEENERQGDFACLA